MSSRMLGYLRSQIYQENLKHISGIHQAYPRQSSAIFLAKLSHITGISQTNHRHTSDIYPYSLPLILFYSLHTVSILYCLLRVSIPFLNTFSDLSYWFLYTFSELLWHYQDLSKLPPHFQISISIASQSCNFMLVWYAVGNRVNILNIDDQSYSNRKGLW